MAAGMRLEWIKRSVATEVCATTGGSAAGLSPGCVTFSGMTDNLRKRVVLVTGAGKRFCRAVALRLAEDGCDVVVHYRSSEAEARAVVGEIEKLGRRGMAIAADLNSVAEINIAGARLAREAVRESGSHALVAGSVGPVMSAAAPRISHQDREPILREQIAILAS